MNSLPPPPRSSLDNLTFPPRPASIYTAHRQELNTIMWKTRFQIRGEEEKGKLNSMGEKEKRGDN